MDKPKKSGKRIVSKAEYVALHSKKASLTFSGTLLLIIVWVGMACGVCVCLGLVLLGLMSLFIFPLAGIVGIALGLGFGYLIIRLGSFFSDRVLGMISQAEEMEMPAPFTQANAASIPAEESLVRASSEPVHEQEAVLLRPSIHSQQTPAEQLLRSVE